MGYYQDGPPRHSHRTPSDLADDEMISAIHGDFCGMPATPEEAGETKKDVAFAHPASDARCTYLGQRIALHHGAERFSDHRR
jgi:hypothetical protein